MDVAPFMSVETSLSLLNCAPSAMKFLVYGNPMETTPFCAKFITNYSKSALICSVLTTPNIVHRETGDKLAPQERQYANTYDDFENRVAYPGVYPGTYQFKFQSRYQSRHSRYVWRLFASRLRKKHAPFPCVCMYMTVGQCGYM